MAENEIMKFVKELGIDDLPDEIYNDETGELIPMDHAKVKKALFMISDIQRDVRKVAKKISEFFGEKLYLYLGLTKAEAAERCLGMSISSVRQIERISDTFGDQMDDFAHLGVTRMDILTKLSDDLKKEFFENKSITFSDGTVITMRDIENEKVKDLENRIKLLLKEKANLDTNIAEMEKNEALYEKKLNNLERENEHLNALNDIPIEEQPFHRMISKAGETRTKLTEAQHVFLAAFMHLKQIDINESNRDIATSGIAGIITMIADQLTQLESYFDISLTQPKNTLMKLAE